MAMISNTISSPDVTSRPTWKSWALFSPVLGWLLVFVVAPTLILFVYAFFSLDEHSRITPDFTLDNFRLVFTSVYIGFFVKSAIYAGATTLLCIAIGYPVAYYIGRSPVNRRNRLLLAVMIPFLTSFLIRTFAWTTILDQAGVLNLVLRAIHLIPAPLGENFEVLRTPAAVMIALVYTYLPFMILPIYGSVEKLDESLIEASYDLGASPMRAFWRVTLPLTMPGISAGTLMVFVPAVAMFAITHVMSGGRIRLIGDVIEEQFVAAQNIPFGSALGMVLLIAFMASFYLFTRRADRAVLGR